MRLKNSSPRKNQLTQTQRAQSSSQRAQGDVLRVPSRKPLRPLRFNVLALVLSLLAASSALAQEMSPSPTPTPADQSLPVPQVAPNYRASRPMLPELGRIGVDMDQQRPL